MASVEEFMQAVKTNDTDTVKTMIHAEPSLVDAKEGESSAILTAVYYGASDVKRVLLEQGVALSYFEAAAVGADDIVTRCLEAQPDLLDAYSHDGFTALGLSAFFGHPVIVERLLEQGAEVNAVSKNGMTVMALHSAVAHGHTDIAATLLAHGAAVNAKQQAGFTPLLEAVHNGQLEMVELLTRHGADVNQPKDDGVTPLQMAEAEGQKEVARLLIQQGAR